MTHADNDTRQAFEDAVYANDAETLYGLAGTLWRCTDIMPSSLCDALDMLAGSTYAQAARRVRAKGTLIVPPPGLDGTWRDSCVVCLRGTDTGLAFTGEAEWVLAGLEVLGIPKNQAANMLEQVTGCDPGMVPAGDYTLGVRLCVKCAAASSAGFTVGLFPGEVPEYRPKGTP
jgi:hypothetical protein